MTAEYKDDYLAELSAHFNVAQFVSFGPGPTPQLRHRLIRGDGSQVGSWVDAVSALLSRTGSVNVRVFSSVPSKSLPFHYGMTSRDTVLALIQKYASDGLYSIVNETIDVGDGGVSGVALGGIVEFAPDGTPRLVEKAGSAQTSVSIAERIVSTVYGFDLALPAQDSWRTEFSVHPCAVGYRAQNVIIWEREYVDRIDLPWRLVWPNAFSRLIGDKAFGLLIASVLGVPVPYTTVISRRIAPFSFGLPTQTTETWLRTCPVEQEPGKFTTVRGWADPFKILSEEDPDGSRISSVLAQRGVAALYSGASLPDPSQDNVYVEGVSGTGDSFMLGSREAEILPRWVIADVRDVSRQLSNHLGPVRLEWAHDGKRLWVLQLHISGSSYGSSMISPGEADEWTDFDPESGLDVLRRLIHEIQGSGIGVRVTKPIGATSHVGDLLRKARVPAKFVT